MPSQNVRFVATDFGTSGQAQVWSPSTYQPFSIYNSAGDLLTLNPSDIVIIESLQIAYQPAATPNSGWLVFGDPTVSGTTLANAAPVNTSVIVPFLNGLSSWASQGNGVWLPEGALPFIVVTGATGGTSSITGEGRIQSVSGTLPTVQSS
jgi:hypothetical protein